MDRREALKKILMTGIGLGISNYINVNIPESYHRMPKQEYVLAATGDLTLANHFDRTLNHLRSLGINNPYDYVLRDIAPVFNNTDMCIVNLEGTFTNATSHKNKPFNFKGDPEHVVILEKLGVNVANLANNHFMDFFERGATDTMSVLNAHDILYCGGGSDIIDAATPRILEFDGLKFGFLGYAMVGQGSRASYTNPGTNPYDKATVKKQVSDAKDICDRLIVSCHWGNERERKPSTEQIEAARIFVDSGADIVLGHHPHVLQEVAEYNHGLVFYSLGNFIFGGSKNPSDKNGMTAKIRLNANGILDYEKILMITHQEGLVLPRLIE